VDSPWLLIRVLNYIYLAIGFCQGAGIKARSREWKLRTTALDSAPIQSNFPGQAKLASFSSSWLRRALLQVHLWSGIALSLYILVICASGSAIVFRRELDKAFCPTRLTVRVQPHRLTPTELKAKAHADYPRVDSDHIEVRAARATNLPVEIWLAADGMRLERLFDPYTGTDLASTVACEPHFVTALADFHGNLGGGRAGLHVNGVGALAITLLVLSGAIVWWPGSAHWWRGMTVRTNVAWQRLVRDLHGALGFWLILLVLLWAITGTYFAFPKPFNALGQVFVNAGVSSLAVDDAIAWVVRLHFGRAFGQGVEVLWAVVGLLPAVLVVTGVMTWWHRVRPRR
jgi:uncharacterized iron-regulated membrane protein